MVFQRGESWVATRHRTLRNAKCKLSLFPINETKTHPPPPSVGRWGVSFPIQFLDNPRSNERVNAASTGWSFIKNQLLSVSVCVWHACMDYWFEAAKDQKRTHIQNQSPTKLELWDYLALISGLDTLLLKLTFYFSPKYSVVVHVPLSKQPLGFPWTLI